MSKYLRNSEKAWEELNMVIDETRNP